MADEDVSAHVSLPQDGGEGLAEDAPNIPVPIRALDEVVFT
jgi:hypothetical protein